MGDQRNGRDSVHKTMENRADKTRPGDDSVSDHCTCDSWDCSAGWENLLRDSIEKREEYYILLMSSILRKGLSEYIGS